MGMNLFILGPGYILTTIVIFHCNIRWKNKPVWRFLFEYIVYRDNHNVHIATKHYKNHNWRKKSQRRRIRGFKFLFNSSSLEFMKYKICPCYSPLQSSVYITVSLEKHFNTPSCRIFTKIKDWFYCHTLQAPALL